jgi:hypothetical protein
MLAQEYTIMYYHAEQEACEQLGLDLFADGKIEKEEGVVGARKCR